MQNIDTLMNLVHQYGDARIAHANAVCSFANDQAGYEPIPALAEKCVNLLDRIRVEAAR